MPVRKKVESTAVMVSWGFQAGSLCCLNALLSGHLEGHASPSCWRKLVLFFIFFLVRGRSNVLESVQAELLSLLLQDCTVCSNLHYGQELLINWISLFLIFYSCAWIPIISLYQSNDCVLWSGCPSYAYWKSLKYILPGPQFSRICYVLLICQLYWNFSVISLHFHSCPANRHGIQ